MAVQYISDTSGNTTAVIIPIAQWNTIRGRYPDVDAASGELPDWQRHIIDARLQFMMQNPDADLPLLEFIEELKSGLDDAY